VAGEYQIKLQVNGSKVGNAGTRLAMKFDGQPNGTKELKGERDGIEMIKGTLRVEKTGAHTLSFRVANPLEKPEMRNDKPVNRTFSIRKLELISPPQPVVAPPTQVRIFAPGRGQPNLDYSARAILTAFGTRAFRRPLAPQEIERFVWIYQQAGKKGGNFEQSVQTALTALLVSPHFLFRGELQPDPDNPRSTHPINEWALASRLSYFLWSTMPDDELFATRATRPRFARTLRSRCGACCRTRRPRRWWRTLPANGCKFAISIRFNRTGKPFRIGTNDLGVPWSAETELLFETIMQEIAAFWNLSALITRS
jgi:hypothetical protein